MSATRYDVVVAGAGMVGACAALALAGRGMRVGLVETAGIEPAIDPGDDYDLRVSAISPRSRDLLQNLGVWQQLDASRVCPYEQMHVWHEHGAASVHFDAVELGQSDLGALVENRLLQQTLQRACDAVPGIDWYRPDRIEHLIDNGETGAVVQLNSGQQLQTALLIAADGRQSPTRELASIDIESGSYHQRAIVANVSTAKPHEFTAWQRFLATGPLAFLPLANGQSSIVWSCDDAFAHQLLELGDDDFRAALGEAFEYRLGEVTATSERRSFPLGWHHCERWFNGRVLLLGDAAHSVHPLAGQGVNQGFSDVELCVALIGDCRAQIPRAALRRFERQRKSETWLAGNGFGALKWLYGLDHPAVTQLRDLGMRSVDATPWLRRAMISRAVNNLA